MATGITPTYTMEGENKKKLGGRKKYYQNGERNGELSPQEKNNTKKDKTPKISPQKMDIKGGHKK